MPSDARELERIVAGVFDHLRVMSDSKKMEAMQVAIVDLGQSACLYLQQLDHEKTKNSKCKCNASPGSRAPSVESGGGLSMEPEKKKQKVDEHKKDKAELSRLDKDNIRLRKAREDLKNERDSLKKEKDELFKKKKEADGKYMKEREDKVKIGQKLDQAKEDMKVANDAHESEKTRIFYENNQTLGVRDKELAAKIKEICTLSEQLKTVKFEWEKKVYDMEMEKNTLESELKAVKEAVPDSTTVGDVDELTQMKNELARKTKESADYRKKAADLDTTCTKNRRKISEMCKRVEDVGEERDKIELENARTKAELTETQKKLEKECEMSNKLPELERSVTDLTQANSSLDVQLKKEKARTAKLRQTVADQKTEISNLSTAAEARSNELGELASLRHKLNQQDEAYKTQDGTIAGLNDRILKQEDTIKDFEEKIKDNAAQKEKYAKLANSHNEKVIEALELQTELQRLSKQYSTLAQEKLQLALEVQKLTLSVENATKQNRDMQQQLQKQQPAVTNRIVTDDQYFALVEENRSLSEQISKLKDELAALSTANQSLKQTIAKDQNVIDQEKDELQKSVRNFEAKNAEYAKKIVDLDEQLKNKTELSDCHARCVHRKLEIFKNLVPIPRDQQMAAMQSTIHQLETRFHDLENALAQQQREGRREETT